MLACTKRMLSLCPEEWEKDEHLWVGSLPICPSPAQLVGEQCVCVCVCVCVFHKGLVRASKGSCFSCQPGLYLKSLLSSHTESPLPPRLCDNTHLRVCTNTGAHKHSHTSAILTACSLICQELPVIEQESNVWRVYRGERWGSQPNHKHFYHGGPLWHVTLDTGNVV